MEKVYKIVYSDGWLSSCVISFGPYKKIYRDNTGILTVDSALCFDTEDNALIFLGGINPSDKSSYELWEAEAKTADYVRWLADLDCVEIEDYGEDFADLTKLKRKDFDHISIDAPQGTLFCKNVRLKERIL